MTHNQNWMPGHLKAEKLREWANATAETTTVMKLSTSFTAKSIGELVQSIHCGAQQAMDATPTLTDRACKAGCPGCCHSMISLTAPEACVISTWLRAHKSPNEIDSIHRRAREIANASNDMSNDRFAKAMFWCPLLGSNLSCSIYQVRPLCCRAWNSLSQDACHNCYFDNNICHSIPMDRHAYEIGQGVRAGLSRGLETMGLDGNHYELCSALCAALDSPNAIDRITHGDDVFGNCHRVN